MVCTREVKQRVRDLEGREYPCPRLFCRPGGADWELILKSERPGRKSCGSPEAGLVDKLAGWKIAFPLIENSSTTVNVLA